ncbi:odorant receptor coreceptor-like [Schistocerca gregaria]|uniref:odorant receptor coreceptor-like n=1 Tax=Schistocerca gregaria TaxID=7010 RepID=UPI00211ECF19|nr:odorant receptor coreceptor-like [Schistocerca gregaria]
MVRRSEEERQVLGTAGGLLGLASGDRSSITARLAECGRFAGAAVNIVANILLIATTGVELFTDRSEETERASITAFLFSVSIINLIKALSLVRQRWRLRRLVASLVDIRRSFQEEEGTRRRYARQAAVFGFIWLVPAEMHLTFWCLDPLISHALSSADEEPQLPLPVWLPFNQSDPSNYGFLWTLESSMIVSGVQLSLFIDVVFVTLIISVTAEIHVLNSNIQSMRKATTHVTSLRSMTTTSTFARTARDTASSDESIILPNSITTNIGLFSTSISDFTSRYSKQGKSADDEMYRLLVKSIQHHQLIVVCVSELEKAVSMGIFAVLSINILNLCSHVFSLVVMLETDTSMSTKIKMFLAAPVFMCQSGLYCLTGQAIIDQSDRLADSAYSCGWPDADQRFKRSLRVLMTRAEQPLCIKVGKLVELSRATFQELLKGTYQLFNLVYQVHTN